MEVLYFWRESALILGQTLYKLQQRRSHQGAKKMFESRPEDALVKLVKTVETARTAHPARIDHFHRVRYL